MLRFIESYDHYTSNAAFALKWTEFNGAPAPTTAGGRFGQGMQQTLNTFWRKQIDAQDTWIVGMAFRQDTIILTGTSTELISLFDGSTAQVSLSINQDHHLFVDRAGTILGTGTTIIRPAIWYYIEFKATINNATGVAAVNINETVELNLTGQDTQVTGNATADKIGFYGGGNLGTVSQDDIYICDDTGGVNDDFLGDVRVEALFPSGNGNSSQWVGSDGNSTDNYLLVDELEPDGDTTFVESSTVGNKDTYAFSNMVVTTGTVYGVQVIPYTRKTDAGVRTIASIARLSGTEEDSADKTLSTSYQYLPDVRETKPGGGSWSITDVNNSEFGEKVTA